MQNKNQFKAAKLLGTKFTQNNQDLLTVLKKQKSENDRYLKKEQRSFQVIITNSEKSNSNQTTVKKSKQDIIQSNLASKRKNSVIVDLTQKPSTQKDLTKEQYIKQIIQPTKRLHSSSIILKSFQQSTSDINESAVIRSPQVSGKLRRNISSFSGSSNSDTITQKSRIQQENGTIKKGWSPNYSQGSSGFIRGGRKTLRGIQAVEKQTSSVNTSFRPVSKRGDETTTLRKTLAQKCISFKLDNTQVVHFQAPNESKCLLNFEPSPIRKFNDGELLSSDHLRSHVLLQSNFQEEDVQDSNEKPKSLIIKDGFSAQNENNKENLDHNLIMPILSPEQESRVLNQITMLQPKNKISECKEQDDKIMQSISSPFKTPRSGNSPTNEDGEENILFSIAKKRQRIRFDSRFNMPQIQVKMLSSLIHLEYSGYDKIQYNRDSLLSKAASRLSSSPCKSPKKLPPVATNDSGFSTQRCLNMSPWKKTLFCCAIPQSQQPPQSTASIIMTPTSRNIHRYNMIKRISSINSEAQYDVDLCDVDEYSDAKLQCQSLMKRLKINNNIKSPGSRIAQGDFHGTSVMRQIINASKQQSTYIEKYASRSAPDRQPQFDQELQFSEDTTGGNNSEHYEQVIQALKNIKKNLIQPDENLLSHLFCQLPQPDSCHKTKTIIFDMDETLIHCVDDPENDNPDIILQIQFPDEDQPVYAGFNIRPYLKECLEEANRLFQVGVFTASHRTYADAILDYIDPENKYFQFRLYREHCVRTQQNYYIKDLRIFRNRSLQDIVLIDNSVYSFAYQIENGVPIIPFYSDKNDDELFHLITYLQGVSEVEDTRLYNREAFHLEELASEALMEECQDEAIPTSEEEIQEIRQRIMFEDRESEVEFENND